MLGDSFLSSRRPDAPIIGAGRAGPHVRAGAAARDSKEQDAVAQLIPLRGEVQAPLQNAAAHWRSALVESRSAVEYLRGRGIGGAIAARFGLGYAPAMWRGLGRILDRYSEAAVDASGLVASRGAGGAGGRRGDLFRDRIMFPIRSADGDLLGFGGRSVASGAAAKYLNSPETARFRKRELLYGLDQAQATIARAGRAIVVEGYFDVIAMAQAGMSNTVGTLGTACTAAQLRLLRGLTDKVVFCFDGDAAGYAAAVRALGACAPLEHDGLCFEFAFLPPGHDPDSFVRERSVDAIEAVLQRSQSFLEFLLAVLAEGCDRSEAEGRVRIAARAAPFWRSIPEGPARADLLAYCSALLRLPDDDLARAWSLGQD